MTRLAALLFLVAAAAVAQPPLGKLPLGSLIDAGWYRVHMYCTGMGAPTVMVIGGFSFDWALVQPGIAKLTRACTYHASGNAWVVSGPDSPPAVISATPIDIGVADEPGFDKLPERIRDLHRWAMSRNPALPGVEIAEACISELGNSTLGELQASLLAVSHNSRQFIADESFHSIEISQPAVVIRAIRQAVEAARK